MKMFSLIDGIFWGALLIVLGVWFLVRRYVPVHIPVIRIIIAALFVYAGIRVLVMGPSFRDRNTAVFSDSAMRYSPERGRDYNLVFSSGTIDLSDASAVEKDTRVQVNVVFGSGILRIDPDRPVRVDMTSAFGTVDAPNGRSVAFGDTVYTTPSYKEGTPALHVHASAVFGRIVIQP
jgi:predicted membrane protein